MPIGWHRGEGAAGTAADPRRMPGWSARIGALAQTTKAQVAGSTPPRRQAIPTIWTRWQTAADERVCPICGPYVGRAWPQGEGPSPPLHPNCRCVRVYAFTTWQVRDT
jgi:hypothetical protein